METSARGRIYSYMNEERAPPWRSLRECFPWKAPRSKRWFRRVSELEETDQHKLTIVASLFCCVPGESHGFLQSMPTIHDLQTRLLGWLGSSPPPFPPTTLYLYTATTIVLWMAHVRIAFLNMNTRMCPTTSPTILLALWLERSLKKPSETLFYCFSILF